jgi:hypothetical protein
MPGTVQPPLSIAQIDREIGRPFHKLSFSAPIERLFLRDYLKARAPMVPLWAFLGTLFYVVAALGDLSMMPDVASMAVGLRLGVFVPYAAMVVIIMRLWPSAAAYDLLSLGVGVLGIALPMTALVFSTSEYLFVYQTGSIATLAFFVIVLRPRLPTILIGLTAMLAIQIVTTKLNGGFDDVTYTGIVSYYITAGMVLAASACFTERMDRQNFLGRLRGEALQAELTRLSEREPMTGLYNRHVLRRIGNRIWARSAPGRTIAAIMLDIDHFKRYNDVHGHVDGDACIRAIAGARGSRKFGRGLSLWRRGDTGPDARRRARAGRRGRRSHPRRDRNGGDPAPGPPARRRRDRQPGRRHGRDRPPPARRTAARCRRGAL